MKYFRDGVETTPNNWFNSLRNDVQVVQSKTTCKETRKAIELAIKLDIAEGRGSTVNGHSYAQTIMN
jgi:hypothetical protein